MFKSNIYLFFFIVSLLLGQSLHAQSDSSVVTSINKYIYHIDTLCNSLQFVKVAVSEGEMDEIIKEKGSKDTLAGFSYYTYLNLKMDTIYRIDYHDNALRNFNLHFYYKNNVLVYALMDYSEAHYKREEYYKKGEIALRRETKKEFGEIYKKRVEINLKECGNYYFEEYWDFPKRIHGEK